MLVVFRIVQGVGAAILFPVSMSVLANAFQGDTRAHAIGLVVGVATIGNAVGPFVGGVLTDVLDWRWVLFINVPIAAGGDRAGAAHGRGLARRDRLAAPGLARDRDPQRRPGGPGPAHRPRPRVGRGLGDLHRARRPARSLCLAAFWLIEQRVSEPLVDPDLMRNKVLLLVTLGGCLSNFTWALVAFVGTIYLQQGRGLSPLGAGFAFLGLSAGTALGGPVSGRAHPARAQGPPAHDRRHPGGRDRRRRDGRGDGLGRRGWRCSS